LQPFPHSNLRGNLHTARNKSPNEVLLRLACHPTLIIKFKLFSGIAKKSLAQKTLSPAHLIMTVNNPDTQCVDDQHLTAHGNPPATSDKPSATDIAPLVELQSEADTANAITTAEGTVGTATLDASSPQPESGQSNATSPVETTAPPEIAGGGRPLSEADPSQVRRGEPQSVSPLKQAAQLSDKADTIVRLAGGKATPRPPQKRKKRKDNKLTFRADDDLLARITAYALEAGLNESEATRQLVEEAFGVPHVIIKPKSPPAHLEFYIGALRAWMRELHAVKNRLNAPMPEGDDEELTESVRAWRIAATDLLEKLPSLIKGAEDQGDFLTNLNSSKIVDIRLLQKRVKLWLVGSRGKLAKDNLSAKEIEGHKDLIRKYETLINLVDDLGISGA